MSERYNVLFLCTGNASRSIMAEAISRHKGAPRFVVYSAGSHPRGEVHPAALRQIQSVHLPVENLRSKSWDEFARPGALHMDFVFTLCDDAAREACLVWPGHPMTAHWGLPDPGNVPGGPRTAARAFAKAFATLDRRISLFLSLPFATLDPAGIKQALDRIGQA